MRHDVIVVVANAVRDNSRPAEKCGESSISRARGSYQIPTDFELLTESNDACMMTSDFFLNMRRQAAIDDVVKSRKNRKSD